MPPEVLSGQDTKTSTAIDVWSLGILCYQLFIGRTPFDSDGASLSSIRDAIINHPVVFPPGLKLSFDYQTLIKSML
jgi:serine/threonine protein kinase